MPVLKNAKHELFAQEVAKGTGLEEAYARAGYQPSAKNAHRLKKKEEIQSRIDEILSRSAQKTGLTVERYHQELAALGFSDIRDVVKWRTIATELPPDESDPDADRDPDTGEVMPAYRHSFDLAVKNADEIAPHAAAAISSIEVDKDGRLKVRLHNKVAALEQIGRVLRQIGGDTGGGDAQQHNHLHLHLTDEERAKAIALLVAQGQIGRNP